MNSLGKLWDAEQYEEEYDLEKFNNSLKTMAKPSGAEGKQRKRQRDADIAQGVFPKPQAEFESILLQEYNVGKNRGDSDVIEAALDKYKTAGGDTNKFSATMALETIANFRYVQALQASKRARLASVGDQ